MRPFVAACLLAASPCSAAAPREWPVRKPRPAEAPLVALLPASMPAGLAATTGARLDRYLIEALAADPGLRVLHPEEARRLLKDGRPPAEPDAGLAERAKTEFGAAATVWVGASQEVGGSVYLDYRVLRPSGALPSGGRAAGSLLQLRGLAARAAAQIARRLKGL